MANELQLKLKEFAAGGIGAEGLDDLFKQLPRSFSHYASQ
jgi:hypothetical protein